MTKIYYRNADAAIVCFGESQFAQGVFCFFSETLFFFLSPDLTNAGSFDKVKYWVQEVQTQEPNCKIFLCGTKKDLLAEGVPRGVSADLAEEFASDLEVPFVETSSKTGENVDFLFREVAEKLDTSSHDSRGASGPPCSRLISFLSLTRLSLFLLLFSLL